MTATIDRPGLRSPGGPPPSSPPDGRRSRWTPTTSPAAELAVVGLTVAAVLGLGRLFVDGSFLPEVLTVVLAAHALAWGARRLDIGPLASVVVSAAGLLFAVGWVIEPGTTT
jgi:hypothetical protein